MTDRARVNATFECVQCGGVMLYSYHLDDGTDVVCVKCKRRYEIPTVELKSFDVDKLVEWLNDDSELLLGDGQGG